MAAKVFWVLALLVPTLSTLYKLEVHSTVGHAIGRYAAETATFNLATHEPLPYAVDADLSSFPGSPEHPGLIFSEDTFPNHKAPERGLPKVSLELRTPNRALHYSQPSFSVASIIVESLDLKGFRFKCFEKTPTSYSPQSCSFTLTGYYHAFNEPFSRILWPQNTELTNQSISYWHIAWLLPHGMKTITPSPQFERLTKVEFVPLIKRRFEDAAAAAGRTTETVIVIEELEYTVHLDWKVPVARAVFQGLTSLSAT